MVRDKEFKRAGVYRRLHMTINLPPITKKNHQRIIYRDTANGKRPMVIPSKQYTEYQESCGYFVKPKDISIDYPVNVKALYYMPTRRRVDLTNLHESLHDILVHYGVLKDDNSKIIVATDGSRVLYDKENPRTEVWIERMDDENIDTEV